jgi:hypothetical protein
MKLIEDHHITGEGGKLVAKSRKYKKRTEQLLKSISAEYTRIVQKYPEYKFGILLETDSDSDKGTITITWTRIE